MVVITIIRQKCLSALPLYLYGLLKLGSCQGSREGDDLIYVPHRG